MLGKAEINGEVLRRVEVRRSMLGKAEIKPL
jgi:hypothetical protein